MLALAAVAVGFASRDRRGRVAAAGGLVVALAGAYGVNAVGGNLEREHRQNLAIWLAGQQVQREVPPGSVIFGNEWTTLGHLQFVGDWQSVQPPILSPVLQPSVRCSPPRRQRQRPPRQQWPTMGNQDASPIESQRAQALYDRVKKAKEARALADAAGSGGEGNPGPVPGQGPGA